MPPGRAGRAWLVARLEVAVRGADLLDRKRRALLREQAARGREAADARRAFDDAVARAETWTERAVAADGSSRLELLARHVQPVAVAELSWSNLMGARIPTVGAVGLPAPSPLSALGGSAAAVLAAAAWREATLAAVQHAAAERASLELAAELTRASRRLRALRERWIPQHEAALARLDLALDEAQREQAAQARWVMERS